MCIRDRFEPQLGQRYRNLMAQYLGAGFATRQLANTCNVVAGGLEQLMSTSILLVGAWIVISTQEPVSYTHLTLPTSDLV